jgi:hypothetical protein
MGNNSVGYVTYGKLGDQYSDQPISHKSPILLSRPYQLSAKVLLHLI